MTDRELLEWAAKAAGYKLKYSYKKHGYFFNYGQQSERAWSPLTDDGDAFRLAVKLGLIVGIHMDASTCAGWSEIGEEIEEFHNDDPYAATRRTIVRAAALIGRVMA